MGEYVLTFGDGPSQFYYSRDHVACNLGHESTWCMLLPRSTGNGGWMTLPQEPVAPAFTITSDMCTNCSQCSFDISVSKQNNRTATSDNNAPCHPVLFDSLLRPLRLRGCLTLIKSSLSVNHGTSRSITDREKPKVNSILSSMARRRSSCTFLPDTDLLIKPSSSSLPPE